MTRSFDAELQLRDLDDGPPTVFGRMFPIGVQTPVVERENGELVEIVEEFLPGCTTRMRQGAAACGGVYKWLTLTIDHRQDFDSRLGCCTQLDERSDGAYGSFELYAEGDKLTHVRSILSKSHGGLSVEFFDIVPPIVDGPLRQRRQIHVQAVTATPIPVYKEAGILAMRSDDPKHVLGATPNLDRARALLAAISG